VPGNRERLHQRGQLVRFAGLQVAVRRQDDVTQLPKRLQIPERRFSHDPLRVVEGEQEQAFRPVRGENMVGKRPRNGAHRRLALVAGLLEKRFRADCMQTSLVIRLIGVLVPEDMGRILPQMRHLSVQFRGAGVGGDRLAEQHLMDEIVHVRILRGPIGEDGFPPDFEEICVLCAPDKAVLDAAIGAFQGLSTLIDEEIALPEPLRQGGVQIIRGIHPHAAVAVQQFHPADVGEMGSLDLPFLPFPDNMIGKIDPVKNGLAVQDDQFRPAVPPDTVDAGLDQGRRLFRSLQPKRKDAPGLGMGRDILRHGTGRIGIRLQEPVRGLAGRLPAHLTAPEPGTPEPVADMAIKGPRAIYIGEA
jgi:hypothetical protein